MALDATALQHLIRLRENAVKARAAARADLEIARSKRDDAQAIIDKIDAALAPHSVVIDSAPISTATLDEVIARLVIA